MNIQQHQKPIPPNQLLYLLNFFYKIDKLDRARLDKLKLSKVVHIKKDKQLPSLEHILKTINKFESNSLISFMAFFTILMFWLPSSFMGVGKHIKTISGL